MARKPVLAVLGCALALASCSDDKPPPPLEDRGELTIYASLPLEGDSQPQSEDIVRAFELALDQHGGGAAGYDIDLVILDDADPESGRWEPDLARANAEQAASDPSTIAYLGEFNSGASVESLPILNQAGILQVSPSNTYVGLTRADGAEAGEPDKYYPSGERTYGRVVPADHVQAGALVGVMRDKGCSEVYIVHGFEIYGTGIAAAVARTAGGQDIQVVGEEPLEPGVDRRVAAAAPDCLFFGGITFEGAAELANRVGAALPDITMFFPDGCAEAAFTEDLEADIAPRVFITNPTLGVDAYPEAGQTFLDDFHAEHGRDPEPYAIYGFEAMSVVLDSIDAAAEAAAASDEGRQAVIDAFFDTEDRESVLGTYSIDDYGDTTLSSYGGYRVEDGALVFDGVIDAVVVEPVDGPEITPPPPAPITELEGAWVGEPLTLEALERSVGPRDALGVFDAVGATESVTSSLAVSGDSWQMFISADGGEFEQAQGGTFTVDGDRIAMTDDFGANYTYRFRLSGDELRIRFVSSDAPPPPEGPSDDAFQIMHFSQPFTRDG